MVEEIIKHFKNLKEFYMMKPFDLRAAKAGAPVCTRDGEEVRIICFDRICTIFPIIGLRRNVDNEEYVVTFTTDGRKFSRVRMVEI